MSIPTCPGQPERDRPHHCPLHPHPNATPGALGHPWDLSTLLALPALPSESSQSPCPEPHRGDLGWPWGVEMSHLGSCSPTNPDPPDRCARRHTGWGVCPAADAHSPARSLGKVLMILITGLVCAINIYFVVDFLPTLRGLGYHIPLGLLLAAYVAFVAYLVGLAPREGVAGRGVASPVGAHRPALFAPTDLDLQHRAWSPVPGLGPPQPVQLRCLPRPAGAGRDPVTDPVPPPCPARPPRTGHRFDATLSLGMMFWPEMHPARKGLTAARPPPKFLAHPPPQFRGDGSGWIGEGGEEAAGGAPNPWHRGFSE